MKTYEKYGIAVGQKYGRADGSKGFVSVLDVETYADCDDVVIFDPTENRTYRIDCFKLAMVRYFLLEEETLNE